MTRTQLNRITKKPNMAIFRKLAKGYSSFCLCQGCRPSTVVKGTFVCLRCKTSSRRPVLPPEGIPVCPQCRKDMDRIPWNRSLRKGWKRYV